MDWLLVVILASGDVREVSNYHADRAACEMAAASPERCDEGDMIRGTWLTYYEAQGSWLRCLPREPAPPPPDPDLAQQLADRVRELAELRACFERSDLDCNGGPPNANDYKLFVEDFRP